MFDEYTRPMAPSVTRDVGFGSMREQRTETHRLHPLDHLTVDLQDCKAGIS